MDIYVLILPLLIGWILDKLLGDPIGLPHPVVGFGKLISFCEKRWNCGTHRMLKGGVAAIMLILLVYAGSVLVLHYLFVLNRWLGIILSAVLVFYCLAGTTLINEVRQVFLAAHIRQPYSAHTGWQPHPQNHRHDFSHHPSHARYALVYKQ